MNNTPCTEAGFKVGDKFEVLRDSVGFKEGQVVTLFIDDGSDCPLFAGENDMHTLCSGSPGAYLSLFSGVTKIEEFKVGDRVSISNITCSVLKKKYKSGDAVVLLWESSDGSWKSRFESDNDTWMIGGRYCDITPAPPAQIEMRRVVTTVTITMTQDVPLDDFLPENATIEGLQEFVNEVFVDVVDDIDVVVTKVSVELVDEA